MHEGYETITIDKLSKTEGHASLEIKIKGKKVEDVKLMIRENRRFYEKSAVGKSILGLNQHLSRICGTCSVAHQFATLKAIEYALDIEVNPEELMLRKLLYYGNMIRDHAMHLYFFVLPDVYGFDSVFDFVNKYENIIKEGFEVYNIGSKLASLIGGRSIHQINISLQGVNKSFSSEDLERMKKDLETIRGYILRLISILGNWDQKLEMKYKNIGALINSDFGFLIGDIHINNKKISPEKYYDHITQVWKEYSHSYFYLYDNEPYFLGALARINLNKKALHPKTKKDSKEYLKLFPSYNIYHNNLAQAIEVLHCIDASIDMIEYLLKENISPIKKDIPKKLKDNVEGYAIIEAPRGLLYYYFNIDSEGKIKKAKIITPTAQNLSHMEAHIKYLVEENISLKKKGLVFLIESLIRAYDPCFSCSSHFLKVRWK